MAEPLKKQLPSDLTARIEALRDALLTGLVERDVPVRLALLAALAGEHLLLIGPPGTAKSLVARRLHLAFHPATYFERLLTRFTVPEELFGPLSIKGLEEDRYERLTEAYLPKASVAFLDEIFKANSAILNALLTLLNEREFDNGKRRESTPLISVVGASNELPEGEELDALFDRFLLRCHVGPVSKAGFPSLLELRGDVVVELSRQLRLSDEDLAEVRQAATEVAVPDDVVALLADLRDWCTAEGIQVSDRRWRKVVKLLQTAALTNGRDRVSIWDCWLLQHCLWSEPEQRAKVHDWYAARAGASAAMDPSRLTRIVVSWEARLKQDQDSRSQARDESGNLLFKGTDGKPTVNKGYRVQARRGGEPLYLAPDDAHSRDPDHYGNGRNNAKIKERTNAGNGFTLAELNALWIHNPTSRSPQFMHWANRDAYLTNQANWHMEAVDLPPFMEPTRQKAAHVDACLKELATLGQQVETYKAQLLAHIASLDADIRAHLWVTDDFAEPAARSLEGTRREVDTLLGRLEKLRQGFGLLPREEVAR
ncbi:ATPase [Myxococcus xanthus]|uniref:AAA family ATPase n=1 Tax=Myxococcus xanthus TaxID=34 RepID=UPI00112B9D73|nr:AAA family ATPase [Myxococcus xanthus]QDE93710.1 ATPase [Myxococcus xanthus]